MHVYNELQMVWLLLIPSNLASGSCSSTIIIIIAQMKRNTLKMYQDVGIADQQNAGKQSRDDSIKLFTIQSYWT